MPHGSTRMPLILGFTERNLVYRTRKEAILPGFCICKLQLHSVIVVAITSEPDASHIVIAITSEPRAFPHFVPSHSMQPGSPAKKNRSPYAGAPGTDGMDGAARAAAAPHAAAVTAATPPHPAAAAATAACHAGVSRRREADAESECGSKSDSCCPEHESSPRAECLVLHCTMTRGKAPSSPVAHAASYILAAFADPSGLLALAWDCANLRATMAFFLPLGPRQYWQSAFQQKRPYGIVSGLMN